MTGSTTDPWSELIDRMYAGVDFGQVLGPAWEAIQANHPDLPMPAFGRYHGYVDLQGQICFPGDEGEGANGQDITYSAVTVEIGTLTWPAEHIFGTLLHEAAHFLDWLRHPVEHAAALSEAASHGPRFGAIAAELGLQTTWWRDEYVTETHLDADPRAKYADAITALADRLAPIHAEHERLTFGDVQ